MHMCIFIQYRVKNQCRSHNTLRLYHTLIESFNQMIFFVGRAVAVGVALSLRRRLWAPLPRCSPRFRDPSIGAQKIKICVEKVYFDVGGISFGISITSGTACRISVPTDAKTSFHTNTQPIGRIEHQCLRVSMVMHSETCLWVPGQVLAAFDQIKDYFGSEKGGRMRR